MKFYTGYQWLLIDAAVQFGLDKLTFEERIEWAKAHINELESLTDKAEVKPLYAKAVKAIRKAQQGIPTGHLVGVDGVCSGIQMMSALTGCHSGANATGLIDPNRRADAYSTITELMNTILKRDGHAEIKISRKHAKQATMTAYYGSVATPKKLFGENTPQLDAFYEAMAEMSPGAYGLLDDLLHSWQPYALSHDWVLPDGFNAHVKVMKLITSDDSRSRVEVDELDHATFTYEYKINEGSKKGLSNIANVTHSVDAYVLRCMQRQCNYDPDLINYVYQCIDQELTNKGLGIQPTTDECPEDLQYYLDHYNRSTMADIVIANVLDQTNVQHLSVNHLEKLKSIIEGMLQHKPFELVTVHDEFKAHANNVNWVRWHYKEILADIADSELITDLMNQMYQNPEGSYQKQSQDLGDKIRQSNYALC